MNVPHFTMPVYCLSDKAFMAQQQSSRNDEPNLKSHYP
ncbi:hypothetical protein BN2497_539 [Janthinobacterium sp. CG23_2]|nr:hypothetical protein BN2497_539 [Janthinobacterium sp. CG23_2]CUU26667.1 hypothetical protein BN3177_539 [Janthinobacterium sp. CG23_2]